MNVKHWAVFLVVTLSANYVSGFFLGGHRGRSRRGNDGWNTCNKRLHGYLRSNLDGIKRSVQSKFGGQCSLGDREWNDYTLKNLRAKGFGNLAYGDRCHYYVEDGQAFIRFGITFERIIASFALVIPEAVGGILGEFVDAILGIIGDLVDEILQIVFPSLLCDVVMVGDYDRGFRLSKFDILRADGDLGFLGGLSGHEDTLGSYISILFEPLEYAISLFLRGQFKPILASGIGSWKCNRNLFARLGLDLGNGGRYRGSRSGGEEVDGESDEVVSEDVDLVEGGSDERESGVGRRTGGSGGRSRWGERGGSDVGGKSGSGRRTGGSRSGGRSGWGERGGSDVGGKSGPGRKSRGSGSGRISGHGGRHGKSGLRKGTRGSGDGGKSGYRRTGSGSGRKSGLRRGTGRSGGRNGGLSQSSRTGGSEYDEESDSEESESEESSYEESDSEESENEESSYEESDDVNSESGGDSSYSYSYGEETDE